MSKGPAVAATIVCAGGTVEMDGHRPIEHDVHMGNGIKIPTRQMRVTTGQGDVVEIALNRDDVRNIIDTLELYL